MTNAVYIMMSGWLVSGPDAEM